MVRLANPDVLRRQFEDANIPLELEDGQAATPEEDLLAGVTTALKYSVRTGHPGFFNQLYARADPVSIAADWLAVAANTNVHTFEVAPVFTAVEVEVLSKLARCIGGQYAQHHDGLFAPGGSISNIYGMVCCSLSHLVLFCLRWTHKVPSTLLQPCSYPCLQFTNSVACGCHHPVPGGVITRHVLSSYRLHSCDYLCAFDACQACLAI